MHSGAVLVTARVLPRSQVAGGEPLVETKPWVQCTNCRLESRILAAFALCKVRSLVRTVLNGQVFLLVAAFKAIQAVWHFGRDNCLA